jgi:hypothetical protein
VNSATSNGDGPAALLDCDGAAVRPRAAERGIEGWSFSPSIARLIQLTTAAIGTPFFFPSGFSWTVGVLCSLAIVDPLAAMLLEAESRARHAETSPGLAR